MSREPLLWKVRERTLDLSRRPLVMGIVNITPDSFSDGGHFLDPSRAVTHANELIAQGADILDLGGESTRPGSQPVPLAEELRRIVPVVERLVASGCLHDVLLSIDTSKAEVATLSLQAGAHIINDVTALRGDTAMAGVVREHQAGLILMHMLGTPATMQAAPGYENVVAEVCAFFEERLHVCWTAGIAASAVVLDPGIGFGKTDDHNWTLLARLEELAGLGRPVCLGVSRKGFLGRLLGREVNERLAGSLAVALDAINRKTAQIVRAHDVAATRDGLSVLTTLWDRRETMS